MEDKKYERELDLDIEIKSLEGKIDIINKCLTDMKKTSEKTELVREGINKIEEGVQDLQKEVEEKRKKKVEVRDGKED